MPPHDDPDLRSSELDLRALRAEYLKEATEKVTRLNSLLEAVQKGSDPGRALRDLHRAFHNLIGSGGTYGFPAISEEARAAEKYVKSLLARKQRPVSEALQRLREHVDKIAQTFAEAGRGGESHS